MNTGSQEEARPRWSRSRPGSQPVRWADAVVDPDCDAVTEVGLGLRFRSPVDGPEQMLVREFLETQFFHVPRGRTLTVFLQPALETGFPDLVAIVWRASRACNWSNARAQLRREDVRLLHLLGAHGWLELSMLEHLFPRSLVGSLYRLEAAGLILGGRQKVRARTMRDIFFVERIVSIEAKVATTQRLMVQAYNNAWFSSESYALLPVRRATSSTVDRAARFGIGLIGHVDEETSLFSRPAARAVPASYGSWLFNEWVWRLLSAGHLADGRGEEARWP